MHTDQWSILNYRRGWRALQADRVPKITTFGKIAEMFEVKKNTVINNYNQAVDYHNQRKTGADCKRQTEPVTRDGSQQGSPSRGAKAAKTEFDPVALSSNTAKHNNPDIHFHKTPLSNKSSTTSHFQIFHFI